MSIGQPPEAPHGAPISWGRISPLLLLGCVGLGLAIFSLQRIKESPTASARVVVRAMEKQVAAHLSKHDERAAIRMAESALVRPEVQWVLIQDSDGQVIAEAVAEGLDPSAIRSEIVRVAWQPTRETWSAFQLPGHGTSHNLSHPLRANKVAGPNRSGGAGQLGTIHVGFRPTSRFSPLDRLVAGAQSMAVGWTSPLRRDLTTRSRQALIYYREGIRANRKYYENEARTAWTMAVEEDPHFAMAMVRLGELAHQLNDDRSARTWLHRAEAEVARVTEKERLEIERLGADLANREADERTIEAELVERFDGDADVLLLSGNQHLNEGRAGLALAVLREALRLDPELSEAWNLIGYAESEVGHWPEAEEAFEKYTFLNRNQANPHDSLGEFYLRTGRYRKALAQFETAIDIKPDFSWAHYHLALVNAELGRWDAALFAIQHARDASRDAPEDVAWSRAEIMINLRAGQTAEANRLLAVHCADFPLSAADRALIIRAKLAMGNLVAARAGLAGLEAAVRTPERSTGKNRARSTNDYLLLEMQGLLMGAEGRAAEGIEHLDAALTAATSWEARLRIERESIAALVATGRHEESLRRLEAILARNPDDPTANWWFGEALNRDGRHNEARVAFGRANQAFNRADLDG